MQLILDRTLVFVVITTSIVSMSADIKSMKITRMFKQHLKVKNEEQLMMKFELTFSLLNVNPVKLQFDLSIGMELE